MHPGWCRNLIEAGRVAGGERVLVVVDEPLVEEGAQLARRAARGGRRAAARALDGDDRPMRTRPRPRSTAARESSLVLFLSQRAARRRGRRALRAGAGGASRRAAARSTWGSSTASCCAASSREPAPDSPTSPARCSSDWTAARPSAIRGRAGTDLTLRVGGRPWLTDATPLGRATSRTTRAARSSSRRTATAPTACSSPT